MPSLDTLDSSSAQQKLRELERELADAEKAYAQETLEHARTKETLAYTRGLLDRADKSEVSIHKYLDRQEERHQLVVGKLEEKVIDANRKIATIARELGAKEERVAFLMGPGRLPTNPAAEAPAPTPEPPKPVSLPLDVPLICGGLGAALSVGVWLAPGWNSTTRFTAIAAVWFVVAWFVMKFWSELVRLRLAENAPAANRYRNWTRGIAVAAVFFAAASLALAFFQQP